MSDKNQDQAHAGQEMYVAVAHHGGGVVVVAGVFTTRRLAVLGASAYVLESAGSLRGAPDRVAIHLSSLNEHGIGPELVQE